MKSLMTPQPLFTANEIHLLRHMTGSADRKKGQGYRNYGAFYRDTPAHKTMQRLEKTKTGCVSGRAMGTSLLFCYQDWMPHRRHDKYWAKEGRSDARPSLGQSLTVAYQV